MTRTVLGALLSHWRRHPLQAATLILGLALATALWSGVQAINAEARASYAAAADALGGARPVIERDGPLRDADYVALRRAGWPVTPVVEGWIEGTGDGSGARVRLLGIDPLTAPAEIAAAGAVLGGDILGFIAPPGRLLAEAGTAALLTGPDLPPVTVAGPTVGEAGGQTDSQTHGQANGQTHNQSMAPGMAFADIGTAQRLLGLDGRLTRLILTGQAPGPDPGAVVPGLTLRATDQAQDLARLTDSFHLNLTAFGLLAFAVGLFIVHGAVGLAFEQRRGTLRTLRALGVPAGHLVAVVAGELLAAAVIAGLIGVALGWIIAAALLPDVAATLRGLYGVPVAGTLGLRPAWWAAGMGIAVGGTAVSSAAMLWRLSRLPVLAPARPRAWARAGRRATVLQGAAALALAAVALVLGIVGGGLLSGFALLGASLLAAALALPLVLGGATSLAARTARGPLSEWFWADTRHGLPGLSLALMALLLALAANIGVGTMVGSFRDTFTGWLDQRLASEIYLTAADVDEAERLRAWLAPRTDAVLPIWDVERDILGAPGEIYGVADHPTYRDNWPILAAIPGVWDRIAEGRAVLINEQLARREGLAPGDPIALPGWRATVGGVYSDYGNPRGQVLVDVPTLVRQFPEVERLRFGIRIDPARAPDLTRALVEDFGLPPDAIIDQASIKAFSLDVFERTFAVTAALNVLTLGVAGFAILTSLVTLSAMRLPQLAPVWALGLTRARLARLELLRTVLLAGLTFGLAIPVGLVLAWVLLAVINVEAFGWRLPMQVFPGEWLRLGVLALAAAALAGLWPAWRLARLAPSELVKVFAHER